MLRTVLIGMPEDRGRGSGRGDEEGDGEGGGGLLNFNLNTPSKRVREYGTRPDTLSHALVLGGINA